MRPGFALAMLLALPSISARAAEPLDEAEAEVARLGALASDVQRAFKAPLPQGAAHRAWVVAGVSRKLADDCARAYQLEAYLTPKYFFEQRDVILSALSCRAVALNSTAPCDSLSAATTSQFTADFCPGGGCPPRIACRGMAARQRLVAGMIRGLNATICPGALDAFIDIPPARRAGVCAALFSGLAPAEACARENAAAGGDGEPEDLAQCRALLGLRGAQSVRACTDKNLAPEIAGACRAAFEFAADPSCATRSAALSANHCADAAAGQASSKEFLAEVNRRSASNPRIETLEAFHKKRVETDALLSRAAAAAGPAPDAARAARLAKVRASGAAAVMAVKSAVGR